MRATTVALIVSMGVVASCRTTQVTSGAGTSAPTEAAAPGFIPEGSTLQVALNQELGSETSREGDRFTATVQRPLSDPQGRVVVPAGSTVTGVVTGLQRSERFGEQAAIKLDIEAINVAGERSPLDAEVVETEVKAKRDRGRALAGGGVGAAAGAVLGAIISQGVGGTLLGGLLGAGAGTVIGLGTGDVEPRLPSGTELSLRTTAPTKVAIVRTGGTT